MNLKRLQEVIGNLKAQDVKVGVPQSITGVTFVSAAAFKPTLENLDPNRNYKSLLIEGDNIPPEVKELMQKFCVSPDIEYILDFGEGNYLVLSSILAMALSLGRELYFSVSYDGTLKT